MSTKQFTREGLLLTVKNVNLSFGENLVLRNVNFTVQDVVRPDQTQGQVVALIGPSGCGKSQLLRIIAGLREPQTGEILIGQELRKVSLGEIGMVFQDYPLFQHRTVEYNLKVAASSTYSKEEVEAKIESVLTHFNMLDKLGFYPCELSGGQRQRIAIAQQILCSGDFLLMDEPFSGLDPKALSDVSNLIRDITKVREHLTVFIVTHDITSACKLADTILILGKEKDKLGSTILEEICLAEMGLAWEDHPEKNPKFYDLVNNLTEKFQEI